MYTSELRVILYFISGELEENRACNRKRGRSEPESEEFDFIHQCDNHMVIVRK